MTTHTYIYTDTSVVSPEGKVYITIHRLVGYMVCTVPNFKRVINDLHLMFPFIDPDKCTVGRIFKSERYDGYSIVAWTGEVSPGILSHLPEDVHIKEEMDYWW